MKVTKILAWLALPLTLGLSSCTEEAEYSGASIPAGAQVFFSTADASQILLEDGQSSVKVKVNRVNSNGPLTVAINSSETLPEPEDEGGDEVKVLKDATAGDKVFTVPSSVTFEEGSKEAEIEITFNFADLEADKDYVVDLELQDQTTQYGDSKKQVVIKYAPWSENFPDIPETDEEYDAIVAEAWAEGTYEYNQMVGGKYYQACFRRESLLDPTKVQYALFDWFYGVNLLIDCDETQKDPETGYIPLRVSPQPSGYFASNYGETVQVADAYTYWHDYRGQETYSDGTPLLPTDQGLYSYYDVENGRFVLQLAYFISLGYFGDGGDTPEIFQMDGYEKADYSVTMTAAGTYVNASGDGGGQLVDMQLGEDVGSVKYALFTGSLTDEEIEQAADDVHFGNVDIQTTSESSIKALPVADFGDYTVVAVTYDLENKRQETYSLHFSFVPATSWTDRYIGDYTYQLWFSEEDGSPITDPGYTMQQQDQDPAKWRITDWGYGTNFTFTLNDDGTILVDLQEIGYDHPTYGPVYVNDIVSYTGSAEKGYSEYEEETGTFYFCIAYIIEMNGQYYNFEGTVGYETYVITDPAVKARFDAAYRAAKKSNKKITSNAKNHRLSGDKGRSRKQYFRLHELTLKH